MTEDLEKKSHGGVRQGAGRKPKPDKLVRKAIFLRQSEWDFLEARCKDGEAISQVLRRDIEASVANRRQEDALKALKERHKTKAAAKVQSVQGEVTELDQRNMEFIADHLSRLFSDVRGVMRSCDPDRDKMQMEALYKQALALEMVLSALDDDVFSSRFERLRPPKGVDVEGINGELLGS